MPPKPLFKPEIANRVERSKRALFSPDHQGSSNQLESILKRKRNACDDDEDSADLASQSSKLFRAESSGPSGLTPRALKIKSQSFCIGAGSSTAGVQLKLAQHVAATPGQTRLSLGLSGSSSNLVNPASFASGTPLASKLHRAHSEMSATPNSSMTDNQRKVSLYLSIHQIMPFVYGLSVRFVHIIVITNLVYCHRNSFGLCRRHCRRRKLRRSTSNSVSMRQTLRAL